MKLIFLTLIVLFTCGESANNENFKPVVVLELFTSQGCSSCPPADALLENTDKNYATNEVITLSYHVDYWNYIGWKDPFSKAAYSDKQRQYSQKFNSSSYTPEMVVNGQEHFVGSNERVLKSKIKTYVNQKVENTLAFSNVKRDNNMISFDYKIDGDIDKKSLEVVLVIGERTTSVSRGENSNRTLKNSNIVVQDHTFPLNSQTGNQIISIPEIVTDSDELSIIGLVKTADLKIVNASKAKL